MTNLEIAQKIANKIDSHSQTEIDAMMDITCEINDIDPSWLFRVVGNLYNYKAVASSNTQTYSESDPR